MQLLKNFYQSKWILYFHISEKIVIKCFSYLFPVKKIPPIEAVGVDSSSEALAPNDSLLQLLHILVIL